MFAYFSFIKRSLTAYSISSTQAGATIHKNIRYMLLLERDIFTYKFTYQP